MMARRRYGAHMPITDNYMCVLKKFYERIFKILYRTKKIARLIYASVLVHPTIKLLFHARATRCVATISSVTPPTGGRIHSPGTTICT